jgi:translocating chain-associated membrane protein 1
MGSGIKRKSGKTPPYLSHEFVIKNHGDIVTCIVMVFIVGMMFQVTYPLASSFVVPKYNITEPEPAKSISSVLYSYGLKDIPLVLFYSLGAIILHAVIQEYVLDVS